MRRDCITNPEKQGWAITDQDGAFEFSTIRPAPYPKQTIPAHLHFTVEGGGIHRQWTDELRFGDDPRLAAGERERARKKGRFGNVRPIRREGGTWQVEFRLRTKATKDF